MKYRLIDGLLHLAHLVLIGFSAFGWISQSTRLWHLCLLGVVAVSWFGLGIRRGWGYCWLTDQQWRFKEGFGRRPTTDSFVEHWTNDLLGLQLSSQFIQSLILWTWVGSTIASLAL